MSACTVVIPARLAATRLPDKPLALIAGEPMIVHVWRRAMEADIGPVLVAAGDAAIAEAVRAAGGYAVLTDPDLPSGSDRVFAALPDLDSDDIVINLQGDLPLLDPALLRRLTDLLTETGADISTLVSEITDPTEKANPNVVKAILSGDPQAARALYFTRASAPAGDGPMYHHIGLYGYRYEALERFVSLPPSPLEQQERLEQLRALEAGMEIAAAVVDAAPPGVDTAEDLAHIRALLES